jgi:hypothetical protein
MSVPFSGTESPLLMQTLQMLQITGFYVSCLLPTSKIPTSGVMSLAAVGILLCGIIYHHKVSYDKAWVPKFLP